MADLRILLEHELNLRFAEQIFFHRINEPELSKRIDKLMEVGAITTETAGKAHSWREVLNPSHHTWTGSDIEDQRQTATQFRDFIYHDLIPT